MCRVKWNVLWQVRFVVTSEMCCQKWNVLSEVTCVVTSEMCCDEWNVLWQVKCVVTVEMCCDRWNVLWQVKCVVTSEICSNHSDIIVTHCIVYTSRPPIARLYICMYVYRSCWDDGNTFVCGKLLKWNQMKSMNNCTDVGSVLRGYNFEITIHLCVYSFALENTNGHLYNVVNYVNCV